MRTFVRWLKRLLWSWPGRDGLIISTCLCVAFGSALFLLPLSLDPPLKALIVFGPLWGYFFRHIDQRERVCAKSPSTGPDA